MNPQHTSELINIIQSLPGIEIIQHVLNLPLDKIKRNWYGPVIFFRVDQKESEGLFFLTRCMDARYWEFGNKWRIELSVGDQIYSNGDRPITYQIFRPIKDDDTKEEDILNEIQSLIDNMYHHFTHDNFMSGYNMSRDKISYLPWRREHKLNQLEV